jgi:hypothetical protein
MALGTLRNARAQEAGKIAPPDQMRRGDAKAAISEREEKGETKVLGNEQDEKK